MDENEELRHLPRTNLDHIIKYFSGDDSALSLLMGNIVRDPNDDHCHELRFTTADIDAIRNHARQLLQSPFLILFDEWSTMGKERPKLKHLLSLLIKCQLFRAADYIAQIINRALPQRPPSGPAAAVDISLSDDVVILVNGNDPSDPPDSNDSVNRNKPDNKPDMNSPNLDILNNNGALPNLHSANFSPPSQGTTRSNNETRSNSVDQRSTAPQPGPSVEPALLLPAISALYVSSQIPATVQPEQSAPSSFNIPAFSGLIPEESNNLPNGQSAALPIFGLGSNSSGPALSKIFAATGLQKSSTQSTVESSSVSDSDDDSDE